MLLKYESKKNRQIYFRFQKKAYLCTPTTGTLAQLVEQRTENPCVPGSIPGGTTSKKAILRIAFFVLISSLFKLYFFIKRLLLGNKSQVKLLHSSSLLIYFY